VARVRFEEEVRRFSLLRTGAPPDLVISCEKVVARVGVEQEVRRSGVFLFREQVRLLIS
jgi:hypothetical protein